MRLVAIASFVAVALATPIPRQADETTDTFWRTFSSPETNLRVKREEAPAVDDVPEGTAMAPMFVESGLPKLPKGLSKLKKKILSHSVSGHNAACDQHCVNCQQGIIDETLDYDHRLRETAWHVDSVWQKKTGSKKHRFHCSVCRHDLKKINSDPRCMYCAAMNKSCRTCVRCRVLPSAKRDCAAPCKGKSLFWARCHQCMTKRFITQKVVQACHSVCDGKHPSHLMQARKCQACYLKHGVGGKRDRARMKAALRKMKAAQTLTTKRGKL